MSDHGLFQLAPGQMGAGAIWQSVGALFAAMEQQGELSPFVAAKKTLLMSLAAALDRELSGGKITVAAATAIKQMNEIMDGLPNSGAGEEPAFDALVLSMAAITRRVLDGDEE